MIYKQTLFFLGLIFIVLVQTNGAAKHNRSTEMPRLISPTDSSNNKTRLTMLFSVYPGNPTTGGTALGATGWDSIQIAVDAIEHAKLFPDYEIVVAPFDDLGTRPQGVKAFFKAISDNDVANNRFPIVLGSVNNALIYTGMALPSFNMIGLNCLQFLQEMYTQRDKYNSLFFLTPTPEVGYIAAAEFIIAMGWKKVYLLGETDHVFLYMEKSFEETLNKHGAEVAGTAKIAYAEGSDRSQNPVGQTVLELKQYDPRIVFIDSGNWFAIICYLHKYDMYGPSYAYIVLGAAFVLPNDPWRAGPWCTDEMIYEVLKSVFYFSVQSPINTPSNSMPDSLGMTARQFDDTLKAAVDRPELVSTYWNFRACNYDTVGAAAFILKSTDEELRATRNETLLDWVTSSQKFRENGALIHSILKKQAANLVYNGLTYKVNHSTSAAIGIGAVTQIQMKEQRINSPLLTYDELVTTVLVAAFDTSLPANEQKLKLYSPVIWNTYNGLPPLDSAKVVRVKEAIMPANTEVVLIVLASFILFINFFGLIILKVPSIASVFKQTLPLLSYPTLSGNILLLSSVFIFPKDGSPNSFVNCTAASLFLTSGFVLMFSSVWAKLEIAAIVHGNRLVVQGQMSRLNGAIVVLRAKIRRLTHPSLNTVDPGATIRSAASANWEPAITIPEIEKVTKRAVGIVIAIAGAFTVSEGIWFASFNPIVSTTVDLHSVVPDYDISLVYQYFRYECRLREGAISQTSSRAFVAALFGSFSVLVFLTAYRVVELKNANTFGRVVHIGLLRIAFLGIATIAAAGGAVVAAFYNNDFAKIEEAIAALVFIVTIISSSVVLGPIGFHLWQSHGSQLRSLFWRR